MPSGRRLPRALVPNSAAIARVLLRRPRPPFADLEWRTAAMSGTGGCVEVARYGEMVAVRDTKNRQGGVLVYTPHEWACFLDGARRGEFDDLAQP